MNHSAENDAPTVDAAERLRRAVAASEARLCECNRIDQVDNPHRHERDEVCAAWEVLGETVLTVMRQRDAAYAELDCVTPPALMQPMIRKSVGNDVVAMEDIPPEGTAP